jgi:hypothetical protein
VRKLRSSVDMDLLGISSAGVDLAVIVLAGMDLGGMDSPGSGQNEDEDEIAHCNGTCYVFADCGFPGDWW